MKEDVLDSDELTMYQKVVLERAVIKETSEADCVAHLMEMYKELTENK